MFAANFLFVLGIPNAIYTIVKANNGVSSGLNGTYYEGMNRANHHFIKQRFSEAIIVYKDILKRGSHAGIHYNLGCAYEAINDATNAIIQFELALKSCGNYTPAKLAVEQNYKKVQNTNKLSELQKINYAFQVTISGP